MRTAGLADGPQRGNDRVIKSFSCSSPHFRPRARAFPWSTFKRGIGPQFFDTTWLSIIVS
ncbi:MAG: hypothetical protein CFE31_07205 [Rhizobiales bacterium PAR1]|nr:MAG: hypothetical protein CFE31_07205 [Rhizobiales bacterium PAR1]